MGVDALLDGSADVLPRGAANVESGFGDVYKAATTSALSDTAFFRDLAMQKQHWDRKSVLAEAGFDVSKSVRDAANEGKDSLSVFGYSRRKRDLENSLADSLIERMRREQPESPVAQQKTTQEMLEAAITARQEANARLGYRMMTAPDAITKYGGAFAGAATGAMLDPINAVTLPLGASAASGVLRAMAIDGVINMGIEALQTPANMAWAKQAGVQYGIGDAALNIATAGAGAAAISGAVRGTGKLLARGESAKVLSDIANDKNLPSEARDAAQYQATIAQIDEGSPLAPGFVTDEQIAINRSNLAETQNALSENREPILDASLFSAESKEPPPATIFERGQIDGARYKDYTKPSAADLRYMEGAIAELNDAYKGARVFVEQDGVGSTPAVTGYKGNFPDWFKEIAKEKGISRDKVNAVFEKMKERKPLGKAEIDIAEAIFSGGRAMREENIRQIMRYRGERYAKRLQDELAVGDREAEIEATKVAQEAQTFDKLTSDINALSEKIKEIIGKISAKADDGGQTVLPGAERISDKALVERKMQGGITPKGQQRPMDVGMFGDEYKQIDMLQSELLRKQTEIEMLSAGMDDPLKPEIVDDAMSAIESRVNEIVDKTVDKNLIAEFYDNVSASPNRSSRIKGDNGEELTFKQLSDLFDEDDNAIAAITTCGVRK